MSDHQPRDPGKVKRQQRLEEQLRENLKRRKEQARARRQDTGRDEPAAEKDDSASAPNGLDGMS